MGAPVKIRATVPGIKASGDWPAAEVGLHDVLRAVQGDVVIAAGRGRELEAVGELEAANAYPDGVEGLDLAIYARDRAGVVRVR